VRSAPIVLEKPSLRRQADFLAAVRGSRKLHGRWVSPPKTPEQYRAFLARVRGRTHIAYFVCTRTGDLAGVIHIGEVVRGAFQSAYLGYYAFRPYAGQGYLRAGLVRVIRDVFRVHRLHRVEANIQPENQRSIALVRSLGFVREGYSPLYLKIGGRWRDHERWALRVETWKRHAAMTASA
jgi:ribosomal-protein-alanine N-acetyltransferase